MADLGCLFETPVQVAGGARTDGAVPEKRNMLKRWDHAAVQALNPQGQSDMHNASLKATWDAIAAGNKAVAYHSNLASSDPYR